MKLKLALGKGRMTLLVKITVIVVVFILLTYGALSLFGIHREKSAAEGFLRQLGSTLVSTLAYDAEYPVLIGNEEMLSDLLRGIFRQKWVTSVAVRDRDGNLLAVAGEIPKIKRFSALELRRKPPAWSTRPDEQTLWCWATIRRGASLSVPDELDTPSSKETSGEIVGLAMVGISTRPLLSDLQTARWKAGFLTLSIAAAGSGVLVFIMRKTIISPLGTLLHGTREIQAGQLSHRVHIRSRDEIGQLASSFNIMAESLQRHTQNLSQLVQEKTRDIERVNKELKDFVYIVSHDLKEPLRGIESFSRFLVEDYGDRLDGKAREYLLEIRDGAFRMKALIEDLLLLSRVTRIKNPYKTVPSEQVIRDAVESLRYPIEEKKAEIAILPRLPLVFCDEIKLREVFKNLLSNAIKFTRELPPRLEVGCLDEAEAHKFYVKDNGIGIEGKYLEKIFEVFQRLNPKDDYEGTGLGLHLVKKIVEEHGGRVWAESTVAKGSTFYFTLPKRQNAFAGKPPPLQESRDPTQNHRGKQNPLSSHQPKPECQPKPEEEKAT